MLSNFFSGNFAVYEVMWKNIVGRGRQQMTVWRMRIAYWITKATDTHTICNTYCLSTATVVARTVLSVTLYVLCLYYILLISWACLLFCLPSPLAEC